MLIRTAIALVGVLIVVALFVALFMQGAYVRYRLQDVETGRMSYMSDATCPEVENGVRSYAVKLASCKMNELNLGARLPSPPVDAYSSALCGGDLQRAPQTPNRPSAGGKAQWLVLRRTSTSVQLQQDVTAGRVKYLAISGYVVRVSPANTRDHFNEAEHIALRDYVMLAISDALASMASQCKISNLVMVLPWGTSQDASGGALDGVMSIAADAASGSCDGDSSLHADVVLHAWGYGISASVSTSAP